MMTDPQGNELPKGVIWDPERKRYRIRRYVRNRVVYLAYTRDWEMVAYHAAQADEAARGAPRTEIVADNARTLDEYIRILIERTEPETEEA